MRKVCELCSTEQIINLFFINFGFRSFQVGQKGSLMTNKHTGAIFSMIPSLQGVTKVKPKLPKTRFQISLRFLTNIITKIPALKHSLFQQYVMKLSWWVFEKQYNIIVCPIFDFIAAFKERYFPSALRARRHGSTAESSS